MRVAIIGAGLAGLACCHELERLGIEAEIFEQRYRIGELFNHVGAFLKLIDRPVKDPVISLIEDYNVPISPLYPLNEIVMNSPNKKVRVRGDLGYTFRFGQNEQSLENQIYQRLKSRIRFETSGDVDELSREFDYVVVASGTPEIPKAKGIYKQLMSAWVRGAIVLGDFTPNEMTMWVDTEFARSGYAYLMPFDEKMASLCLVVSYIEHEDVQKYWKKFLEKRKLDFNILEDYEKFHPIGYTYPRKVGKVFYIGIAGGFMESLLGFGVYHTMTSGVIAARCIADKSKDYHKESQFLIDKNIELFQLRLALDKLDNKGLDYLITTIGMPGIKHIIYNTNFNFTKFNASVLSLFGKISAKKFFHEDD